MENSKREIRIVVMGATGSGKSTFINMASGSNLPVGRGLESCTDEVQISQPFVVNGRVVILIDTPGFDDTTRSDTDVLSMVAAYLSKTYEHGTMLAGVIYMHRISDVRMGGTSTRNFKVFREICGESSLKNVLIVTNMWSAVRGEIEEAREAELANKDQFFKSALEKGAQLLRHDGTLESAHTILRYLIDNHPAVLRIQQEIVDEHKSIEQTAAGFELRRALEEQANRHKEDINKLRAEMEAGMRARDEETRGELQKALEKTQQDYLHIMQQNSQRMAAGFAAECARLDVQMMQMEAVHQKQLQTLTSLQDEVARTLREKEGQDPLRFQKKSEDSATKKAEGSRQPQESNGGRKAEVLTEETGQKRYLRNPLEEMGRAHIIKEDGFHIQKEREWLAALAEIQRRLIGLEKAKTSKSWPNFIVPVRTASLLAFCYFMLQALQEDLKEETPGNFFRTAFLCLFGFFW